MPTLQAAYSANRRDVVVSGMRSQPFADSMQGLPKGSSLWISLAIAAIAVRNAESALRDGCYDLSSERAARKSLPRVTDVAILRQLRALMDATARGGQPLPEWERTLGARLLELGQAFQRASHFKAAGDVALIISENFPEAAGIRIQAFSQWAHALRSLSRFDEARLTYEALKSLARVTGATAAELHADLGQACVLVERGNIQHAEPIILAVLRRAEALGEDAIVGRALIDRAGIAGERRDHVRAIQYTCQALRHVDEAYRRDRALINLGYAFREELRPDPSARIARHLWLKAEHADDRVRGLLLQYHLRIDVDAWTEADRIERELHRLPMPPSLRVEYHEAVGRHRAHAGDSAGALQEYRTMLTLAEDCDFNTLIFRAEKALSDVSRGTIPSLYALRPKQNIPRRAQRILACAERTVDALCAV